MEWAEEQGVSILHIQPGQPQQNAYIERYNRTVRHEWLDQYIMRKHRGGARSRHAMAMDI
jgi:transposase InsO family protein